MIKSVLFSAAVVGALSISSMAYAAGEACVANPAGASAAIDAELAAVTAGKSGAALDTAISGYVAQLSAVPASGAAGSCIYSAMLKAASLASPDMQARINQVAAAYVANEQVQTAALGGPAGPGANDAPGGDGPDVGSPN